MKKFTKLNENLNVNKVEVQKIEYFDLFSLLRGLEKERPGIRDRVWAFLCDEDDIAFRPIKGRIMTLNLYYYGVGDEYPLKYAKEYPQDLDHSKRTWPDAFAGYLDKGSGDKKAIELRLDFNLIWYVYQDDIEGLPDMPVMPNW